MLRERVRALRHVFKLDPAKPISEKAIQMLATSGTDAILVGGTDGVTFQNTADLLCHLQNYAIPCFQEISTPTSFVPGFQGYFTPSVLNTDEAKWILGMHHQTIKAFGPFVPWDKVLLEAYVVLNPDAKVAKRTNANTNLQIADVIAYAQMAEWLQIPIFYVEYSGTYGRVDIVQEVSAVLHHTRLCYGGGIRSQEQAEEMATWADMVVVGNLIYEDLIQAIHTVKWVKSTKKRGER
ncbi:heptaprenylglyceryl phosphate synthase [Shimazuella sp. AN120528]|uniref:heptaprenylglyceryl phosphate synthase n=1 Tax=Shimazuella soli TaxID=1892854 RepID=UPI001F0F0227|nr:heptaprenylglyceryl phosphate synthase [Shimazuella soli]MCH5586531.1 heptaprenylglyceryl phosphate synthase [Shimazuella soli]